MFKTVAILGALLALSVAAPQRRDRALQTDEKPAFAKILKSVQQQTVDGSYGFAFESDDGHQRNEISENGVVQGSYSYVDADGVKRTVKYTAGPGGFQAEGDHLPKAPLPVAADAAPRQSAPARPRPAPQQHFQPAFESQQPQFFPQQSQAQKDFAPPSAIEQQQLADQQRLLDQTIAQHQQFLADVSAGKIQPASHQDRDEDRFQQPKPQFQQPQHHFQQPQQHFQQPQQPFQQHQHAQFNQDFRSLQLPIQQFLQPAAPSFQSSPFQQAGPPNFRSVAPQFSFPAQQAAPQFSFPVQQGAPRFSFPAQQTAPRHDFNSANFDGTPFKFQLTQDPGRGFNYIVQN